MDPYQRLRAIQSGNPSIRTKAAQQPAYAQNFLKAPAPAPTKVAAAPVQPAHTGIGDVFHDVGNFGAGLVSGLEQAGGHLADIAVRGGSVLGAVGDNLNPFLTQQQRDQRLVQNFNNTENIRNAIRSGKTVTGESLNPYKDYVPTGNFAKDAAAVGGEALQTGLDATMFFNPTRVGAKALLENPGIRGAAKDIAASSAVLGGTQGVATGAQTYGETGDVGKALAEGAKSGAIATGLQGVLGGVAHGVGTLISKTQKPATQIARSTSPEAIHKVLTKLHPNANQTDLSALAGELAKIKDKDTVKGILDDLSRTNEEVPVEKAVERSIENQPKDIQPIPDGETTPIADTTTIDGKTVKASDGTGGTAQPRSNAKDIQFQKQFDDFVTQKNEELNKLVNENPNMTPQELEAAKQKMVEEIQKTYGDMQAAHEASAKADESKPQGQPTAEQIDQASQAQSGTGGTVIGEDGSVRNPDRQFNVDENGTAQQTTADSTAPQDQAPKNSQGDSWDEQTKQVLDQLETNKGKLADQDKARKVETAQRAQAGDAAYDKVYAETGDVNAAMMAKMAAQRGEKTKANIEPVNVSDEYSKGIINDIQNSDRMSWEKTNTQNAFRKMFGSYDEPLQNHDIKKIQDYYNSKQEGLGDDVATLLHDNKGTQEDMNMLEQIAGAPRTAMTIADASALRQMAVSLSRHPIVTTKNYIKSFEHMFSGKKFDTSTDAMSSATDAGGKNYSEFMNSVMKLHLPNVAEQAAEEGMSSAQILSKIPLYGKVVDASNRGMSSAVAHTRFELAKNFIDNAGGIEEASKLFSEKELRDLGEVLNTITGRGGKSGGFVDKNSRILSNTLFSGRLWASRLNMLNPVWYAKLSGPARKEALSSLAAFSATAGAALTAIAQIPGVEVGTDPRSADFGKVKVGNTRYDITGGFVQYPRIMAQILSGQKVSSTTGEEKDTTIGDILGGVAEGKLNPLLAYAWTIANTQPGDDPNDPLTRKNEFGEDVNLAQKAGEMTVPLNVSGIVDTSNDVGDPFLGALMNVPAFFGAGVQTYGNVPTKGTGGDTVKQAKAVELQAKKDKATYKNGLDKQDKEFLGKSEDSLNQLVNKGVITEDYKQNILRKTKEYDNIGQDYTPPKGVNDDLSKSVYKKWDSMTKFDQDKWLADTSTDDTSKSIADTVNKDRVKGLGEFKPSNALSKLYADYQKSIGSAKDLTELDKVNKAKAFQSAAAKLNYNPSVRDLYTEGSSNDTKGLIGEGKITQEDLNNAIELDNQLYASGLTGSLKFSKKFRNTYGLAGAPAGPYDGGSGSGGSKTNAHLADFLISSKVGDTNASALPKFSSKARTTQKVKTPSLPRSSAKKVSIKL